MTEPTPSEETAGLVDVFANFQLSLDSLNKQAARQTRALERQLDRLPLQHTIERLSSPGAATFDVQDFGTPFAGHRWVVRLLGCMTSDGAIITGVVSWYVGPRVSTGSGLQVPTSARWQQRQIPEFDKFTSDSINVKSGERLTAGITGLPAQSIVGLVAAVDDYLIGERANG